MQKSGNTFIICKASAGAGKTFTLVAEYLAQAFDAVDGELGTRFRRVLAITFTNKAAGEMKERIMGELEAMSVASATPTPMTLAVAEALGVGTAEVCRRARVVHSAILHSYSDLAVCTIDSFMHRIVRTFAHDLGLPMNFEVMVDQEALVADTVGELLSRTGLDGEGELTDLLRRFAESRMEEGRSYDVEADLKKLAADLLKEDSQLRIDALKGLTIADFVEINRQYTRLNRAFEAEAASVGCEAMAIVAEQGLSDESFFRKSTGLMGFFRRLSEGTLLPPNSYAVAAIEQDKRTSPGCGQAAAAAIDAVWPRLTDLYDRAVNLMDKPLRAYNTRRALQKNLFAMALMGQLHEIMHNYSAENEVVHISEFNKQIFNIVQNEPAPFVYERLGSRYKNFLVDEFQDTSRLQWQNLVPLIENGVGGGNRSLVVGDGKQAIYRFRQGDVSQFVALPHVDSNLHGRLLESDGTYKFVYRLQNRRTGRNIVNFNNNYFSWTVRNRFAANDELQRIYVGTASDGSLRPEGDEELRQEAVREGGSVRLVQVPASRTHDEAVQAVNVAVAETLEAGFSLRDIAVIARDKATLAIVGEGLQYKVTSSESFLLSGSRLVMLVVTLLRHIANPSDRPTAFEAVERLAAMGLVERPEENFYIEPAIDVAALMCRHGLDFSVARLRAMSLYDCCEELLRMVSRPGFETSYAATFLSVVASYAATHRQNLNEFLEWFDQQKSRLSTGTSDDLDAVRLLTIHKAKGLEFPVVICPMLNRREPNSEMWVSVDDPELRMPVGLVSCSKSTSTIFDSQRDAEQAKVEVDNLNILYVALTRPRERLCLITEEPSKNDTTSFRALLRDYASLCPEAEQPDGTYLWGELQPYCRLVADGAAAVRVSRVSFPDWNGRIAIAATPSSALTPLFDERVRQGLRLHAVLALVTDAASVPTAVARYAKTEHLPESETVQLLATVQSIVQAPQCADFFSSRWHVRNECELIYNGTLLRPDRVLTCDGEAWVVDYKTGVPMPEHRAQVERYAEALRAMGMVNVRAFVLYTSDLTVA
ncbi:MAG: UvrD-helicase domain-containing protein [Bacteroidales bacterium]|nr:UvrD-helicase domain-containing protein [Bacteroidales bacterium]